MTSRVPLQRATRIATWMTVAIGLLSAMHADAADSRPNIILIMADDMGYSDIGCYGGEIATPHLDQLAAGGLRYTQFYNTGRCCPTRASLLTGLYPHQAGVGWMMTDRGHDGYRGDLNRRCVTIAETLRPAGYSTYMAGKWHVTRSIQPEGPKHNWPRQRGFDRFYGTITGAGSFFDPATLTRDNTMVTPWSDSEYTPETYYYTDAISDHAVRFIDDHSTKNQESPFFLYVAYTAAHWPMHALPKDIERYRGRYNEGYAPVRAGRLERLRELGLIDKNWTPAPLVGDWDSQEHQAWESACMEVYAAMIDNMDQGIGRIVASLKANDLFDNTLVLFLQDNGGCQETVGRRGNGKRPAKASLAPIANDKILLEVIPNQNRAGVPTLKGPGVLPGPEDTYIAYGLNWANVSNTPFREYKHFVHEGGISTPLIAHWPKGIDRGGELEHQPAHLIDLMATFVDLAEADYPKQVSGADIQPLEGTTLKPSFDGNDLRRAQPIFWEHEGNRAVRDGQWKLVAKENKRWELYDMKSDRPETRDLAKEQPDRVKSMAAAWQAWAKRANVLPLGTWRGKPETFNRDQRRFELKANARLGRDKAPFVDRRPFVVEFEIKTVGEGVIIAQGGSSDGYAIFIKEKELHFAVRRRGKLTELRTTVETSPARVRCRLQSGGAGEILVNGEHVAQGALGGLLPRMPVDGLDVGRDRGGAVGEYESPFPFTGQIGPVVVEIAE